MTLTIIAPRDTVGSISSVPLLSYLVLRYILRVLNHIRVIVLAILHGEQLVRV